MGKKAIDREGKQQGARRKRRTAEDDSDLEWEMDRRRERKNDGDEDSLCNERKGGKVRQIKRETGRGERIGNDEGERNKERKTEK